jgi:hypothetical protein
MAEQQVAEPKAGEDDQFIAGGDENWLDEFPALKEDEASRNILSQFNSREEALAGAVEAQKKVSSGFRLPANLTDSEVAEVRAKLASTDGVPENHEDYLMNDPPDEVMPPEMKIDEDTKVEFKKFAKDRNLPPQVVQEIYEFQKAFVKKMVAAHQEELAVRQEDTKEILLKLWGGEKGVATKLEYLKRHLRKFAATEDEWVAFQGRMFKGGLGDEPILLRALGPWAEAQEAEGGSPPGQGPTKQASDFQKRLAYAKDKWPKSPSMWPKE